MSAGSLLDIRDVTVKFGGITAVDQVSLSVASGEVVGLIGPNGAGKSSLFAAVAGVTHLTAGSVEFDGESLSGKSPAAISRLGVARTFQKVRLFPTMSILDNVATAAAVRASSLAEARSHAHEMLTRCGIASSADLLVTEVPLADRKKVEIARSLACSPRLLMLDEMMNGLTVEESSGVMELVEQLPSQGITVILVEHVMPVVRRLCARLVVLSQGAVIADGVPDEALGHTGVREAYLGTTNAASAEAPGVHHA